MNQLERGLTMLDIDGATKGLSNKEIRDYVNKMTFRYFGVKPDTCQTCVHRPDCQITGDLVTYCKAYAEKGE